MKNEGDLGEKDHYHSKRHKKKEESEGERQLVTIRTTKEGGG